MIFNIRTEFVFLNILGTRSHSGNKLRLARARIFGSKGSIIRKHQMTRITNNSRHKGQLSTSSFDDYMR